MSDSSTFKLSLRGYASIPHLAERAFLKLAATTSQYNKQATADAVITTAHHIEAQIREVMKKFKKPTSAKLQPGEDDTSLPISHWSKTSLTSTSYNEQNHGSKSSRRLYTATINFDVRFRDFEALGDFSARLSSLDHCEIESIDWKLMNSTRKPFESRLRTEAAADALLRAKDYCSVFCPGSKTVKIMPVEVKQENSGGAAQYQSSAMHRRAPGASGSGDSLIFTPQECRMDLNVVVDFVVETSGIVVQLE